MPINPQIGEAGGQQYDVAKAIRTFLGQMAEGGVNVAAAVIKELLQNADDAGATEVHVVLDERMPGDGIPEGYQPLLAPAILVRNNAPFRLRSDVGPNESDDFTAIRDVASGHKRAQATAAGRFGIGFNSVYFLTDTPVLFSRREVHVFDLLHRIFTRNGWRFPLEDFPADAGGGAGAIKTVLERALPKLALGSQRTFGQLAGEGGDYGQAILRLPLRVADSGGPVLHQDRFTAFDDRLAAIHTMAQQAARSVLFLKSIEEVTFGILTSAGVQPVASIAITPPTLEFKEFVGKVAGFAPTLQIGDKLAWSGERKIQFVQNKDGAENPTANWSFYVKHVACFDNSELLALRKKLDLNDEKATPWASIAVPLDAESMSVDGERMPFWRVFLPLLEAGPCACLINAALFVGPSRQRAEFRLEGSDEAKRKTEWNKQLVANGVVPLMRDVSWELLALVPDLIQSHPKEYLSLFPVATDAKTADSLSAHLQGLFAKEPWPLRVYDIWQQSIEILIGDSDNKMDMVPEWAIKYRHAFAHLSSDGRHFIPWALGDAIRERLGKDAAISFHRGVADDVANAVLEYAEAPNEEDLARLIESLIRNREAVSSDLLVGRWAFKSSRDGTLVRYDANTLFVVDCPEQTSQIHQHLRGLGIDFKATTWVSPDLGLTGIKEGVPRTFENVRPADDTTALELLGRVPEDQGHDSVNHADAIAPVVTFLLEIDSVRLSQNLRLAFMVKTAANAFDRRAMGVILLPPDTLSRDRAVSHEDQAVWETLLRPAFAQVDPAFATELRRLLQGRPQLLSNLSCGNCAVATASVDNALGVLHTARVQCPERFARLVENVNNPRNSRYAAIASLAMLDFAERQWSELTEEQRTTVKALPIHRMANGCFTSLCDETGTDTESIKERFRLQSGDDIRDAPLSLPDCQLLNSDSNLPARFYRRTLGLEEHGRAAVLKDALRQIGEPESDSAKLLQYLAKYYGDTISRLSESTEPGHREDLLEIQRLFNEANLVPCLDGKWRPTAECFDAKDVAEYLRRRGWHNQELPKVLSELFFEMNIASFAPEVRRLLQDLGCKLQTLEPRLVPQHAIGSESPRLFLLERVKLLIRCEGACPPELSRAAVLADVPISALSGIATLGSVELLDQQQQPLPAQVLRHIAARAVDIVALARNWELSAGDVAKALRALRVPVVDTSAIHQRLTNDFGQVWTQLGDQDRINLLAYIALRSDLAQALSDQFQSLPTVLAGTKNREWKKPDQIVAPRWLATDPPHVPPDRIPAVGGVPEDVLGLWNHCCGVNALDAILQTMVQEVQTHRTESWKSDARTLYAWLDRLATSEGVDAHTLSDALQKAAWVLARKANELRVLAPNEVVIHEAAEILSQRFWVAACPLPACVRESPERFGFAKSLSSTPETLRILADCMQTTTVLDGPLLYSTYQLILDIVSDNDHLIALWSRIAHDQPVYHLFRGNHGPVSQLEIYLGDHKYTDDYGSLLFCLKTTQLPRGLLKTYRALGVEDCPTSEQALSALCRIAGSQRQLRSAYRGLLDILVAGPTDLVSSPELRVPACSGTYEPIERCFWSEGFGHSKRIKAPGRGFLIDVDDPSARRLMEWLVSRNATLIRALDSVSKRELASEPEIIVENTAAQQVLGPWRDLLVELYRDGSILQGRVSQSGITLPAEPFKIVLVRSIRVRHVLSCGTVIEQDDGWEGPPVVNDGGSRIFVAESAGDKDYIGAGEELDALHQKMADELVSLLQLHSGLEPQLSLAQELLGHLDRPTVFLERMHREYQEHFFHQYHDQVADPEFARLFEEYRRTREHTPRHDQLKQEMRRILSAQYVNARREQIRGYGYDSFSVFAELLQNAEDAYLQRRRLGMDAPPSPSVSFRYNSQAERLTELVIEHFGRQFNYWRHGERQDENYKRDVEGVLRSAGSFKPHSTSDVEGENPIGRFGLGFKSVYLITDRPRIHSGFWHFAIEASCLPVVLSPPADLGLETTRIELPLRDIEQEFHDENGSRLLTLMPFLREVRDLCLRQSDGSTRTLQLSVELLLDLGNGTTVEKIAISGVDHVRGGIVRLVRLRDQQHAGQIAVFLAADGQPSPWSEAFSRDMFVSLPLSARLGCGIAASHRFAIQSGRTHLVVSETNSARIAELAMLLQVLPDGLAACAGTDVPVSQMVSRFWELWRWDSGDTECQELRKTLARELAAIPQQRPFIPTLDEPKCVSFQQGPVFHFDGIPEKVRDVIVRIGLPIKVEDHWEAATTAKIAADSFVQAYLRTCRFAESPVAGNLKRLDWQVIGTSCKERSCLAAHPELLNAVAESLQDWKKQQVLEWLPDCRVRGRDSDGAEIQVLPRELTAQTFPGEELLPRRFLRTLDSAYGEKAAELLHDAGLLRRPAATQLCDWIMREGITQEEGYAILRYLGQGNRFMDAEYRNLDLLFRSPWFPAGNSRLSSAEAFAAYLIPAEIVSDPVYCSWLGMSESPVPEPPPKRLSGEKTTEWLNALFDWWEDEGEIWTRLYERRIYHRDGRPYSLRDDFHANDLRDRQEWLCLFLVGALHTMGRQTPEQHAGFLRLCDRKGWLNTFADPAINATNWMQVLEDYLEENSEELTYYQWMSQFLRIYHLARWLPEYVAGFLAVNRARDTDDISQIVTPSTAAMFQGGGPTGPTIDRTLGIGFCFVIRELTRLNVLRTPLAWPHCFVPSERVRNVLWRAGCDAVGDNSSRGVAWSPQIYEFLEKHLGPDKAIFLGGFDLPLIAVAEGAGPAHSLPQ